jgi:hypothetical protein
MAYQATFNPDINITLDSTKQGVKQWKKVIIIQSEKYCQPVNL